MDEITKRNIAFHRNLDTLVEEARQRCVDVSTFTGDYKKVVVPKDEIGNYKYGEYS